MHSASQLPRAEPRGESLSIGWSLVELAAVLERFEDTHEFILATPDGRVPTLDINGLALAMEGGKDLGLQTAAITVQQGAGKPGPAQLRDKRPELVARRESELALCCAGTSAACWSRRTCRTPTRRPHPSATRSSRTSSPGIAACPPRSRSRTSASRTPR